MTEDYEDELKDMACDMAGRLDWSNWEEFLVALKSAYARGWSDAVFQKMIDDNQDGDVR